MRRRTYGRKSIAVEEGKTVAPPSSVTTRGIEILRDATSRKTSTCIHQWVGTKTHMRRSPLTPR
jgi:hypothetical protein